VNTIRQHTPWILTVVLAITCIFGGTPVLRTISNAFHQRLESMQHDTAQAQQTLRHLQNDAVESKSLSEKISPEDIEKILAPVDRMQAAAAMETIAAAARMHHFTYSLSPEQNVGDIAESALAIKTDASLDTEIFQFIDNLQRTLPGRLVIKNLTIERSGTVPALDNLHCEADMLWQSNGSINQTTH
jgi:hypothetical protein